MSCNSEIGMAQRRRAWVSSRSLLAAGAALAVGLLAHSEQIAAGDAVSSERRATPLQLTLPAPTGAYAIGTVSLHLIDYGRQDPYWSTAHARELMVSVFYPTHVDRQGEGNLAPWMPSEALTYFRPRLADFFWEIANPPPPPELPPPPPPGSPPPPDSSPPPAQPVPPNPISLDGVRLPITHALQRAPVAIFEHSTARDGKAVVPITPRFPVVIWSPGYGDNREQGTALVENLASHGYVVVTISHTYEAGEVQFPGGRVELHRPDFDLLPVGAVTIRREDARFVIDALGEIAAGANPDAEQRPVPPGLGSRLDLRRIGMFGHSLGGATAVQTMAHDVRVIAGIDLDGTVFPDIEPLEHTREELEAAFTQLATSIGDRPFLFITAGGRGQGPEQFFGPFMDAFWGHLSGWHRFLALTGAWHYSFTDNALLLQECVAGGVIPPLEEDPNLTDAERAIAVERAYVRAFFDRWIRNVDTHLLDGPSEAFPEMVFY